MSDNNLYAVMVICFAVVLTATLVAESRECLTGHDLDAHIAQTLQDQDTEPQPLRGN